MAQKDHEDYLNTRATINIYIILKGKKITAEKTFTYTGWSAGATYIFRI